MPFVREQNPWIQAAGVTGDAASDLGRLMVNLPMQKLQMQRGFQDMQAQRQQMDQSAQQAPLQRELLQGRVGLQGEQGDLLQQHAGLLKSQADFLNQRQAALEQQTQAIAQLLQQHPELATAMYGKQPVYRQGGGVTYNAMTGQPNTVLPQKLNPGQSLTGVANAESGNPAGIIAQSPVSQRQTNPFSGMGASAMKAFGEDTNSLPMILNGLTNIMKTISGGGGGQPQPQQMPQRQMRIGDSNNIPQPEVQTPTNTQSNKLYWTPNGYTTNNPGY